MDTYTANTNHKLFECFEWHADERNKIRME